MAILKVARLGHPVLRQPARPVPVEAIGTPEIQRLIDDLIETMRDYNGVGIAAPQVHVGQRIVVVESGPNPRYPDAPPIPLAVYINPELTPLTTETEPDWEGCLSIPDLRGLVPRIRRVRLAALDREGRPVALEASGWHARILQHECDHLDGRVYLDRMPDLSTLTHLTEYARYWAGRPPAVRPPAGQGS
ncbi:MAG TPA: peptide deformylase [Thermodesulfobacteriota bacterium]|nr:peptide deformylase [Thermodesulfobacteriota bacterium]